MEIQVMEDILGKNDQIAMENQVLFKKEGIFVLNLLGSPGSGKTSLLEKTMAALKDEIHMAVIEGDLFTSKDAERIAKQGIPVVQINTRGACHLDGSMIEGALTQLPLEDIDLLIIENIGNLVCPAEFDLGEDFRICLLSVTEGEDKIAKYPLMFKDANAVVLNKMDLLPYVDFELNTFYHDLTLLNPKAAVFEVSCKTANGLPELVNWIKHKVTAKTNK